MDNQPQDFNAQGMAAPVESHEQSSSPFQYNGASLPGVPTNEQYQTGQNYQGLAPLDGLPQGVGIGVEAGQEGLMRDAMVGMLDPAQPFPHVVPGYEVSQNDSQVGITTGAIQVSLSGSNMYVSPAGNLPVGFHEMANTNPEIAGESHLPPMTTPE